MPLIHSGSDAARNQNIRTLMHDVGKSPHVQSRDQALAIAYETQRRSRAAGGGNFGDYQSTNIEDRRGEDEDTKDHNIMLNMMTAPQQHRDYLAGPHPDMSGDPMADAAGYNHVGGGTLGDVPLPKPRPKVLHRAEGGGAPWYVKNEARSMAHVGPIRSSVPGRTDHIPLNVPNGSYVLPAQHVSHLGQNNTEAGFATLGRMFSKGPFGASQPHIGHGHLPSAPKPPHFADGGDVDDGEDTVPIMAAGGEYVVHPRIVRAIGDGNLDHGHRILDEWVKRTKAAHAKTIAKLPGPAKD